jgi:hypothetical protein
MKVYIAGPMRGKPDFNRPAFDDAEALLRDLGHDVVNPCRLDEELGLYFETDADVTPDHLKEIMARDIAALYTCDRIAMLPGWESSGGAALERQAAHYVGISSVELTAAQLEAGNATRTSAHATESRPGSP